MNKLLFLLTLVLTCVMSAPAEPDEQQWEQYKTEHGKTYENANEELYRKNIFLQNKNLIEEHNKQYELGQKSFKMKINKFADRTNTELRKLNGIKKGRRVLSVPEYRVPKYEQLPESVDWRSRGAVTAVKNQGQCGSCYAFSATGSLEGQTFLKSGKLVSLSEQNLVDCSYAQGNRGCQGGLMTWSFEYIKQNGGIDTEESYPYTAKESDTCDFTKENIGAILTGYTNIRDGSESDLQSAVANVGPISVAIDAGHTSFHFYESGIYYENSCSSNDLDHGVLVVGYGSSSKGEYWIVKNSWGTDWGQDGYILMAKNRDNNCGIASMASYPNV